MVAAARVIVEDAIRVIGDKSWPRHAAIVAVVAAALAAVIHVVIPLFVMEPLGIADSLLEAYAQVSVPAILLSLTLWLCVAAAVVTGLAVAIRRRFVWESAQSVRLASAAVAAMMLAYGITGTVSVLPWLVVHGQLDAIIPSDLRPDSGGASYVWVLVSSPLALVIGAALWWATTLRTKRPAAPVAAE